MKIEQHIYARTAKPLYTAGEGYGTVSKTPGLADAFVKEKLHPLCGYPAVLQNKSSITVANFPCGKMLLGQCKFKQDNDRGTFFVRNYVLPSAKAALLTQNIDKLRRVDFENDILDAIDELPMIHKDFSIIQLDTEWLAALARYITAAVYSGKRAYVVMTENSDFVWNVLQQVYPILQIDVRQLLGFTTYATGAVNKEGLHLIFITKDGAKDPKLLQEFVVHYPSPLPSLVNGDLFATLPLKKFLNFINLLHIRLPGHKDYLHLLETKWLNANLNKLSLAQTLAIPKDFIMRGKKNNSCELHIAVEITQLAAKSPTDTRYKIGAYMLAEETKERVLQNLTRLFGGKYDNSTKHI